MNPVSNVSSYAQLSNEAKNEAIFVTSTLVAKFLLPWVLCKWETAASLYIVIRQPVICISEYAWTEHVDFRLSCTLPYYNSVVIPSMI